MFPNTLFFYKRFKKRGREIVFSMTELHDTLSAGQQRKKLTNKRNDQHTVGSTRELHYLIQRQSPKYTRILAHSVRGAGPTQSQATDSDGCHLLRNTRTPTHSHV
eukprot:scpid109802/ scgid32326/ 